MKKICLLFLLYCNINTLSKCCDYCYDGVKKKTKWKYFLKYNTPGKRTNAWKTALLQRNCKDDDAVPVVWEQHDKKKGCVLDEAGEATMVPIPKDINVQTMYNMIFEKEKLKSLVLYFNGDPDLAYDRINTRLKEKLIGDEDFLFNKNSKEPLLQRIVFISYYAERNA